RNGSPPDSPVVDLSVSFTRVVSNVTHFALASLTAFVDVGDALLVQGVAQSDALRTPLLGCCMVGGEAFFSVAFDATSVPLAIDLVGTAHRIGPWWGFLTTPGGIEINGFPSELFVDLRAPLNEGDASLEYHAVLPPNSGEYRVSVHAAAFIDSFQTITEEAET